MSNLTEVESVENEAYLIFIQEKNNKPDSFFIKMNIEYVHSQKNKMAVKIATALLEKIKSDKNYINELLNWYESVCQSNITIH